MRYGVVLPIQAIGVPLDQLLDDLIVESVTAEEAGFDAVFLPEFHQARGGAVVSPLIVGAAILQATTTLRFGPAVLATPLHHPVKLAENAIMLDWMSRGRFILGLGIGHQIPDFELFGADQPRRASMTEEALDVIEACLTGEPFGHEGRYYEARGQITPRPFTDPRPPIWMGSHAPAGLDRAARRADRWICDPQRDVDVVATLATRYRERCEHHGRPARVAMFREAWIGDSVASCRAVWGDHALAVHRLYYNVGAYQRRFEPWVDDVVERADFTFDRLAPGRFLCGSGDDIISTIGEWQESTGCDYLALRFRHPGGPGHPATVEAIRRFGAEVIGGGR